MGYSDKLEHYVMRCVERCMASKFHERHGLVTSYDPKNYLAKVTYQPGGQSSGWLPIQTGHIGNGYGMAVGLEVGDGEKTGDQVIVSFNDDLSDGKIVQRVASKVDKPPGPVESGEWVMWTKWGQQIRFNKDGSLTFKTGVPTQPDQPAQSPVGNVQQQQTPQSGAQQQKPQSNMKSSKTVTVTLDAYGNHSIKADTNIQENAQSQITNQAGQSWTSTAPTVNTVGETHLGSTGGKLLSMSGTVDTAGHADIPPAATKVYAT
jgi:hypothetical protein